MNKRKRIILSLARESVRRLSDAEASRVNGAGSVTLNARCSAADLCLDTDRECGSRALCGPTAQDCPPWY